MRHRKTRQWMQQCFAAEQRVNQFIRYLDVNFKGEYDIAIRRMRALLHNWNVERTLNSAAFATHNFIHTNLFYKQFLTPNGRFASTSR